MSQTEPLKSRHREILNAIVRNYIETGEPVGSHSISRSRNQNLSPASIRNVMADLAEEGYLSQPHTSAGRVPTEKAFRFYVGSLVAARPAPAQPERQHQQKSPLPTLAPRVQP
jgi:heat-inducible transcriptional repressor